MGYYRPTYGHWSSKRPMDGASGYSYPKFLYFYPSNSGSPKHTRAVSTPLLPGRLAAEGRPGWGVEAKMGLFRAKKKFRFWRKLYDFPLQNHLKTLKVFLLTLAVTQNSETQIRGEIIWNTT